MADPLFSSARLGDISLGNRVVMAPMTRDRAGPGDVPTASMVEYYAQRSTAGLIITEGVQPSAVGKGYWRTPGIYSEAQIAGWRMVTDAVHARGGKIVLQLMHCGRVVVTANRGFDAEVVAPSPIPCPVKVPGPDGTPVATAAPRELTQRDIDRLLVEFAQAASNAVRAGFDGVELHCASGYLINQFLNPASNMRTDRYGGSPDHRASFPAAVLQALTDAIGPRRVGFRISPGNPYNGMDPASPETGFVPFLAAVEPIGLAYAHLVDMGLADLDAVAMVRGHFSGPLITNNGLSSGRARHSIETGRADAVSFGRAFIANPDLVERLRRDAPLMKPDYSLLYTGGDRGYIDYPAMDNLELLND